MANEIIINPSYWASVSGGKDSLYMLKLILSHPEKYRLDGVIHFELEIDFPFIKNVIDYMESECKKLNIPFVRITPRKKWIDLYNSSGYPTRKKRWCNGQYKMDAEKQLKEYLKTQNKFLVKYVGLCADEVKRFKYKETKDGIQLVIYPLVEYGIEEKSILKWAKSQSIFNDFYLYNTRCGCMCCPLSSLNNLVYTKKYYPNEYNYYMNLAFKTEKEISIKLGRQFSIWQSNPKYDTQHYMKRVDEILTGVCNKRRVRSTDEKRGLYMTDLMICGKEFHTPSAKLNKALTTINNQIVTVGKASEMVAKQLSIILDGELWKDTEYEDFNAVCNEFNIGKQHGYKVVKAYKRKYESEFLSDRLASYSLSQIIEMITLNESEVAELIDNGDVNNGMTLAEIRAVVKAFKDAQKGVDVGDDLPDENDGDASESATLDETGIRVIFNGLEVNVSDEKIQKALYKLLEKYNVIEIAQEG